MDLAHVVPLDKLGLTDETVAGAVPKPTIVDAALTSYECSEPFPDLIAIAERERNELLIRHQPGLGDQRLDILAEDPMPLR